MYEDEICDWLDVDVFISVRGFVCVGYADEAATDKLGLGWQFKYPCVLESCIRVNRAGDERK